MHPACAQANAMRPRPAIDRREIRQLRLSQRGVTAGETREHGLDLDGPTIGQIAALY
jgi:hypothetical protein